ncbi:MAG: M28 family peptidase [Bacteroidales bacterium]|nr:M28 family peptidase [Bacteroidales bacterium]
MNTTNKSVLIILTVAMFAMTSCGGTSEKKGTPTKEQTNVVEQERFIPPFDADSAYNFVRRQVDFGPRVPNTPAAKACAEYLVGTLSRFCDTVVTQAFKTYSFDRTILDGQNIIGSFNPDRQKRIFLAAHWDSRPFADNDPDPNNHKTPILGANDGASGVGVLLEIARQMALARPEVGVDIIFFDVEDYGAPQDAQNQESDTWGLGAQHWAKTPHAPAYKASFGILLDMVGDHQAQFPIEAFSNYYANKIVKKVWDMAEQIGYGDYFPKTEGAAITDDHYYINKIANIPTVNIIHLRPDSKNGSFVDYWHTLKDDISNISPETLKVVGEVVLNVVYKE